MVARSPEAIARRKLASNARAKAWQKRPKHFVAIDSEGVSDDFFISIGEDKAQRQRTIFWGAAKADGEALWLNGDPYCTSDAILDWLLDLPKHFGKNSIFIWFGSSYDATQIFADLTYEKAWELQNGKQFKWRGVENAPHANTSRYVFYKGYGISYLKQKCLKIVRLLNPHVPYDNQGKLRASQHIVIYDVFGFFQCSFLKAAKSIPGSMTETESLLIAEGKKSRGQFALSERAKWQAYTQAELNVLARMMTALRASMEDMGLYLQRWQGAGSIASAVLKLKNSKEHFYPLAAFQPSEEQQWAHRAFFGGRIECHKQGRTSRKLHSYDIRSAYPYWISQLPSMARGRFRSQDFCSRDDVARANILSMFEVIFECDVSADPLSLNQIYGVEGPEFYPLPYRDKRGCITYPPRVHGIYMAEEIRATFDWIDTYQAFYRSRSRKAFELPIRFQIVRGLFFEPAKNAQEAFPWVRYYYALRQEIVRKNESGSYDLTEKVIKLGPLNSVYGKLAQSVGTFGKAPSTACPWYAAAITAGTRAQLLRAALTCKPGSIVAFQTDGIISESKLDVKIGKSLGEWDYEYITETSIFVQPGVYHVGKEKPASKHRGIKADLLGTGDFEQWLHTNVADQWADETRISVSYPYRYYVTLGAAVASEERWKAAGFWVDGQRELKLDNLGFKRSAPLLRKEKIARSRQLVKTLPKPAYYHEKNFDEIHEDLPLSEQHIPEWLDLETKLEYETDSLNEEIFISTNYEED